jgi:C-terminal processing protease CtpA/Prc
LIDCRRFEDLERFKKFLLETFQAIERDKIRHLIIDIRRNGGGDSALGDELLQYIANTPFRQFEKALVKASVPARQQRGLDRALPLGSISPAPDEPTQLTALRENPLRYRGKLYLLTSGSTYSSAASFAAAFKCFALGPVIGEETGQPTLCSGDLLSFETPNSRMQFSVSHKQYTLACGGDPQRGMAPDYPVGTSLDDDLPGRDGVLEFALKLTDTSVASRERSLHPRSGRREDGKRIATAVVAASR